jgi:hypothetical protein
MIITRGSNALTSNQHSQAAEKTNFTLPSEAFQMQDSEMLVTLAAKPQLDEIAQEMILIFNSI